MTFTESASQSGGQITGMIIRDIRKGLLKEVTRESIQESSELSQGKTTQTPTQRITQSSMQQTTPTSAQQSVQASTEREIGEPTNYVIPTESTSLVGEDRDVTSGKSVRESTEGVSQLSTQLTTSLEMITGPVVKLKSTVVDYARGLRSDGTGIKSSIEMQESDTEGYKISSSVIGEKVTEAA